MHPQTTTAPWLSYVIPIAIVAIVMLLRWRSMSRARRLRLGALWIMPAVYAVVAILVFVRSPPAANGWLFAGIALLIGAALGWQRGRMMRITIDPETHALSRQASPAAFLLLIGLILIRQIARAEFPTPQGHGFGHGAMLATDIAIAFGLGLLAATRIEMSIRARRLLAEARGERV